MANEKDQLLNRIAILEGLLEYHELRGVRDTLRFTRNEYKLLQEELFKERLEKQRWEDARWQAYARKSATS